MPLNASIEDTVRSLATHAVPLYFGLLAAVLLLSALVWWLLQRYGVHRDTSRFSPGVYVAGHLALGFGLIVGAAAVFAELAEALGDGEKAGALDLLFSDTLRATQPRATLQWFAWATHFGDTRTLVGLTLLVTCLLLWRRRFWWAAGLLLAVVGNSLLNVSLKAVFQRTRPVHDHGLAMAEGFSFPSGHSSGSVVLYGMLAWLLLRSLPPGTAEWKRMAAVLAAAAIAFTTGSSRVLLQVHFATDVMAGFASGAAWLAVCVLGLEWQRYRSARRARVA